MSWPGEVWHVLKKDARASRAFLAVYFALVAAAALGAAGVGGATGELGFVTFPFLYLAGALLIAVLVQGDSPARVDAFWAVHPFRPSAILAAKLVGIAGFVVGAALLGQLVGLLSFDVRGEELLRLLVPSAAWLLLLAIVVAVIATLTSNLRSFAAALATVIVAWWGASVLIFYAAGAGHLRTAGVPGPGPEVVGLAGLALLLYLYHTRAHRRATAAGIAFLALAVAGAVAMRPPPVSAGLPAGAVVAPIHPGDSGVSVASMRIQESSERAGGGRQLVLTLELAPAEEGVRRVLVGLEAVLSMPDGSREELPTIPTNVEAAPRWLSAAAPFGNGEWSWIGGDLGLLELAVPELRVQLSPSQFDALSRGVGSVLVEGLIEERKARVLGEGPVEDGTTVGSRGRRFRILGSGIGPEGPTLELQIHAIGRNLFLGAGAVTMPGLPGMTIALRNPATREAILLGPRSGTGGSYPLLTPGVVVTTRRTDLAPGLFGSHPAGTEAARALGPQWLDDAEFVAVEWIPLVARRFDYRFQTRPMESGVRPRPP